MDVDEALSTVGGMRRWNITMLIVLGLSSFMPLAGIGMMFVFIAWTPPHHCKVPTGQWVNQTIPEIPGQWGQSWSKCSMYTNFSLTNDTISCPNGWTYYADGVKTIVTEWDLVCEYNYLPELSETLSLVGCLVAEMTLSVVADKYGRRNVHLVGILLIVIFGSSLAVAPNYTVFLIIRPLASFSLSTLNIPGATLSMELFNSKYRVYAEFGMNMIWSFSYMFLALLGYLVQDWRTLVLILSLPNVVFLFHFWTLPESVWWLTANNKYDEAEEVLQKMAKWNGLKVQGRLLKQSSKSSVKREESVSERLASPGKSEFSSTPMLAVNADEEDFYIEKFCDLFTHPILLKHTIMASLMSFACELVYSSIILTTPNLAGDRYLNFFLGGLVEIPAYILVFGVIRYTRRIPVIVFYVLSGASLITATLIPPTTASGTSLTPLIITISLSGKFFMTATFSVVMMYSRELFPTNLRGTSTGIRNILGRVGSMVAPFMAYVSKNIAWLPNIILGSVAIVMGIICLKLPETADKPLPQKLEDIDRLFGNNKCKASESDTKSKVEVGSKTVSMELS